MVLLFGLFRLGVSLILSQGGDGFQYPTLHNTADINSLCSYPQACVKLALGGLNACYTKPMRVLYIPKTWPRKPFFTSPDTQIYRILMRVSCLRSSTSCAVRLAMQKLQIKSCYAAHISTTRPLTGLATYPHARWR